MTMLFRNGQPSTPSGLKVAAQSYASLEQIARQLDGHLPLAPLEPYKLDCVRILENTLIRAGFRLKVETTETLNDCAAFTIPEQSLIVFRDDIYDLLHKDHVYGRSTVIHELSHSVLQHAVTLHRGAVLGQHRFCEDSEWQAKALTAAIMMPIAACRVAISAEHLAWLCGTSVTASTYRLDRLKRDGLIGAGEEAGQYG